MAQLSVIVADQHSIVRSGVQSVLGRMRGLKIAGSCDSGREAVRLVKKFSPSVVITDIPLLLLNGLEAARQMLAERPQTRVIILSALQDDYHIEQAVRVRVSGYLLKSAPVDSLLAAVRAVCAGKTAFAPSIERHLKRHADLPGYATTEPSGLTGQQIEVLELIALDFQNKQIAQELEVSDKTVDKRVQRLMDKLNLHSRVALANFVRSAGHRAGK